MLAISVRLRLLAESVVSFSNRKQQKATEKGNASIGIRPEKFGSRESEGNRWFRWRFIRSVCNRRDGESVLVDRANSAKLIPSLTGSRMVCRATLLLQNPQVRQLQAERTRRRAMCRNYRNIRASIKMKEKWDNFNDFWMCGKHQVHALTSLTPTRPAYCQSDTHWPVHLHQVRTKSPLTPVAGHRYSGGIATKYPRY